jgi:hypothetical protein
MSYVWLVLHFEFSVLSNAISAGLTFFFCWQNIAFILHLLFSIANIVSCFRVHADPWMTVLVIAMISPILVTPLYGILLLRDECIWSYAMRPPLILLPECVEPTEFYKSIP